MTRRNRTDEARQEREDKARQELSLEQEQLFIVGIDVTEIPGALQSMDAYYKDRWYAIRARNGSEAIRKYAEEVKGWLRSDEKPFLFVDELPKGEPVPMEGRLASDVTHYMDYAALYRLTKYGGQCASLYVREGKR